MIEHLCMACAQLRQGDPRTYDRPHVCEGCRSRLRSLLVEVVELYASHVTSYTTLTADGRDWEWRHVDPDGTVHDIVHHDPLAALPAGPTRSSHDAPVSGSRTPPLPVSANVLDLTLPPHPTVEDDLVPLYERTEVTVKVYRPTNPHTVQLAYPMDETVLSQRRRRRDSNGWLMYGPSGDQVGDASAPTVLDSWARDWQIYEWALLPEPTVSALSTWLLHRLDWACDHHPAIDDFAAEVDDLCRRLRPRAPQAELKRGVPCRDCDRVTLYRWPGSDYIECGSCPVLMTTGEYERWTQLIAAKEHQPWVRQVVAGQREDVAS